ncbi:MAG TPA: hypothetical protein VK991_01460 [Halomonas sp.]|nr:hypothetical protein [Halomonas sp.]
MTFQQSIEKQLSSPRTINSAIKEVILTSLIIASLATGDGTFLYRY